MKFELDIKNTENIEGMTQADQRQMVDIIEALVATGSFTGVRGGQAIIHYDHNGIFQKIEHKYFPWVRRNVDKQR